MSPNAQIPNLPNLNKSVIERAKERMIETVWSIIVHLGSLLLTFYSLCILCDEHLVPAVEVFIKQFQVPEEVAGEMLSCF